MHLSHVGIRRAVINDSRALEGIRLETAQGTFFHRDILSHLTAPGVFTYLAEDDAPFGFVTVGTSTGLVQADFGEMLEWYVSITHRQLGYGRKLLVHGLTVLKRRMYESAVIWLPVPSGRAGHIILKQGFETYPAERMVNVGVTSRTEQAYIKDLCDYF